MTTKQYGQENSWTLGTCSSNVLVTYSNNEEYIEECCLDVGVYTLNCQDAYGDGWHGGSIEIQGKQYCVDFTDGSVKSILVTIGT